MVVQYSALTKVIIGGHFYTKNDLFQDIMIVELDHPQGKYDKLNFGKIVGLG